MSAAWASVRFRLTVTLVARSLIPCLFDIKDDGVAAYAFDGLGVGGADANNRALLVSVMLRCRCCCRRLRWWFR